MICSKHLIFNSKLNFFFGQNMLGFSILEDESKENDIREARNNSPMKFDK